MAEIEQEQQVTEDPPKKGICLPVLIGIILGIIIVQAGIVLAALKIFAPSAESKTATPPNEHLATDSTERKKVVQCSSRRSKVSLLPKATYLSTHVVRRRTSSCSQ